MLQRIRGPCHNIDDEMEAIKASVEESERELGVIRDGMRLGPAASVN